MRGEKPPGPRSWPLVGSSVEFQGDPLSSMERYQAEYGDFVWLRVPRAEVYLVFHPEDTASVLVGEHAEYMKDALLHEVDRFVGRGLLTSEGSFWRRQRKIAAPVFKRRHIERFADVMVRRGREAAERMAGQPGPRDVHHDMMVVTLQVVLDTMFGAYQLPDIDEVGGIVEVMLGEFQRSMMTWRRVLPMRFRAESFRRMNEGVARLDEMVYAFIEERRRSGEESDDLLGRLLAARDEDGHGMSDRQIRDEVATVFLAGHETTALVLSYTLLLLAQHPRVAARLAAEVDEVLEGRDATLGDIGNLPFTDAVVREAMRLYPPAYLVGREALSDRKIRGYTVPRGAQVLTPIWTAHRDPRWWDEPLRFSPERWLDGLASRLHRFAYFPFGGGPRICVGNHFAMQEAVLVLATLVQHLQVAEQPGFSLELRPAITLRPKKGVHVQVRPRPRASTRVAASAGA